MYKKKVVKIMRIITNRNNLRQIVSAWLEDLDNSCYSNDHDYLIEHATSQYLDYLRMEHDFRWGDHLPENDNFDIYRCLEQIEKKSLKKLKRQATKLEYNRVYNDMILPAKNIYVEYENEIYLKEAWNDSNKFGWKKWKKI